MRRRFNDTGVCVPDKHFLADTSAKLAQIFELIEQAAYFSINRPRQYGKTTIAYLLSRQLVMNNQYLFVEMSFEGIGDAIFEKEESFCPGFVAMMAEEMEKLNEKALSEYLHFEKNRITGLGLLSETITSLAKQTDKKIVLSIDEIDKSSNNQLFLSFLGMLREKYLQRNKQRDQTFQSVILIGVHDVKTLKLKISPESPEKFNSPWNIAIDFKVEMSFNPLEIAAMLSDYVQDRGVIMDVAAIAGHIHYYTSGYPYLISKLCKFVDEDILPQKQAQQWDRPDIDAAFRMITYGGYTTTLFDSLTKYLEDDPDLYRMIFDIAINGASYDFNINAPVVNKAAIYGIIRDEQGACRIHNRIFEQRLYGYFLAKQATEKGHIEIVEDPGFFSEGQFNLRLVLAKFQEFMRENYAQKDAQFLEREGRLLFLSFLRPILNGKGFDFKEPVTGDERRMDIVITYQKRRYVVELKRWRGEAYHQQGLGQLSDYLDTYALREGYLLIFDFRKDKAYKAEGITFRDKEIFAVWV